MLLHKFTITSPPLFKIGTTLLFRLGGIAFGVLVVFLHLNSLRRLASFRGWLRSFDFMGAGRIVGGMVLVLFGLIRGGDGVFAWYILLVSNTDDRNSPSNTG